MSREPIMMSLKRSAVACAAALLLAGCGPNPAAQFAWRDSTNDLIPDARKAVQKTLRESFGTPNDLVAWERLPVEYGGVFGVVAPSPEGAPAGQLTVQLTGAAEDVAAGADLLWLTGKRAEAKNPVDKVASLDAQTGTLQLKSQKGEAPAAGDRFAIGFGHQLQLGRVVYMKNCNHCHGVAGDGNGPTAQYLNPRPRDYRLGLFKFTATQGPLKATRDDLHRIIADGIPGTYMPSFKLLGAKETKAVIEYVRWLAMRGEYEKRLDDELADFSAAAIDDELKKAKAVYDAARESGEKPEAPPSKSQRLKTAADDFAKYVAEDYPTVSDETADFIADAWKAADDESSLVLPKVARVTDDAASRERGRLLYMSDRTKCYTCHGPTGKGNGAATEDFWPKPGSTEKYARRGLHDFWGNPLQPRDLTKGQYRGGRRPLDVYRRIFAGIKGTPMPAFGGTVLKDEEIWDLVNYVMSIPYAPSATPGQKAGPQMAAAGR